MKPIRTVVFCGGVLIAVVLFLCGRAGADPGSVIWSGGSLRLVSEHPSVALTSECIVIEPGIGASKITVDLEFHNQGDAVTAQMGFPTLRALGQAIGYYYVKSFVVEVDGEPLPATERKGKINLRKRELSCTWYLFEVPFQAGQKRKMRVRYDQRASYTFYDRLLRVPYVLATGGTWRGSIGEVRLEVHLGERLNYHDLVLKADDEPLNVEETDDTLVWTARDYDGTPALLELCGKRGPAEVRLVPEGKRSWGFNAVRWRRGVLLTEVGFLSRMLCLERLRNWGPRAEFTKNRQKVWAPGYELDLIGEHGSGSSRGLFVDPTPVLKTLGGTVQVSPNDRGDAVVTFTRRGLSTDQTALARTRESDVRIKCLDALAACWSYDLRKVFEEICRRTGEDPEVLLRCLEILSKRDPDLCVTLSRDICGRENEHQTVLLWTVGFLADQSLDDAAPGKVRPRLGLTGDDGGIAVLCETVLKTRYDYVIRGGALVLATLDKARVRNELTRGITSRGITSFRREMGRNAGLALRVIKVPGTCRELMALCDRSEPWDAVGVLHALAFLGDDEAVPYLLRKALDVEAGDRELDASAAAALSFMCTSKSLEACAHLVERATDGEVAARGLAGFDFAVGCAGIGGQSVYGPGQAPGWGRRMTHAEACRIAVLLLERIKTTPTAKRFGVDWTLRYARRTLAAAAR